MFSERLREVRKTASFKVILWSSAVFISSSTLLFSLFYFLLAASLEDRDRIAIQLRLATYEEEHESGGLSALRRRVGSEQGSGKLRDVVVRVADQRDSTVLLLTPEERSSYDFRQLSTVPRADDGHWLRLYGNRADDELDVLSARLSDGSLLQVGSDGRGREDVLERFRNTFIVVLAGIVALGFAGGTLLASRALRPARALMRALQPIIETGKLNARVPVEETRDEFQELSVLLNRALERIDHVVESMRDSLDNVAHDLRTPMTRLRGIAEIALATHPGDEGYREALADCLEESANIVSMLDTLLDISEVESGAVRLELADADLAEIVHRVVEMYGLVADERNIALEAVCPERLAVVADQRRLAQAIANLVDNAVKYTPEGGRVRVETVRRGDEALVTVRDTGIGIPPHEAGKIWDRSFRGDSSRSKRGLGLGLSLVRAVAHAHHGTVEMSTEVGSGSCFTLHLPAAPEPRA